MWVNGPLPEKGWEWRIPEYSAKKNTQKTDSQARPKYRINQCASHLQGAVRKKGEREREKQTERQTDRDRQTDRQTDSQIARDRQIDRDTQRERDRQGQKAIRKNSVRTNGEKKISHNYCITHNTE